jgi:hypothetical protein
MAGITGVHMGYVKCLTTALSVLFIASCAPAPQPPPAKTVFDPLTQQLDRARDAQKIIDEQAAKSREAIDSQERGETSHP